MKTPFDWRPCGEASSLCRQIRNCTPFVEPEYTKLILPVVLFGWETWSVTLREERGLRVFDYRLLRRIFRRKRDEVTGYWRRLHNEELHDLYSWNIIRKIKSRRMRWAGNVAHMGKRSVTGSIRKLEGKRPLGRPCRRWNDSIKICRLEIGWGYVDLFDEA